MPDSALERDPLEILADEFAEQCRAGETPSISDYVARLPERADEIRELFPSVAMMERLRKDEDQERSALASVNSTRTHLPESIGDYQILREVGSGGMGIVYESIQSGLERRVALKVMNAASMASAKQVQRFEREARAAAALHHTNIVPVFAVGYADGRHFYAMQFIDGVGLDEIVAAMKIRHSDHATSDHTTRDQSRRSSAAQTAGALRIGRFIRPRLPGSADSAAQTSDNQFDSEERLPAGGPGDSDSDNRSSQLKPGDRYWKSVALIGVQVADALHYAHSHGILHRDVKPQNLLIDHEGNVWVTDFGLVKLLEHDNLTRTGDIVGTLGYMAPEQFQGKGDRTSDVFSLGLTLYELLTLQPAWRGTKNAVVARRMNDAPFPGPRTVNRNIPRDLETIILKACAPDRSSRYSTAAELAQDLQRFIEDRPILARRANPAERLLRWTRRNPALAVSFAAVAALLVMMATMATLGRMRVEALLEDSQTATAKAEQSMDRAIEVLDSAVKNVSARGVPRSLSWSLNESSASETELTPADAELLEELLAFYTAFSADNAADDRLHIKLAEALRQAGEIQTRLGRLSDAEDSYRAAQERFATLAQRENANADYVRSWAATTNDLGLVLLRRGQFRQTLETHLDARDFLLGQPDEIAKMADIRFELARSIDLLASISIRSGAEESPLSSTPEQLHENPNAAIRKLIQRLNGTRNTDVLQGTLSDTLQQGLADATSRFEQLVEDYPDNDQYQLSLARSLRHQLSHAVRTGDAETAQRAFRESIRILESLVERSPDHPAWLFELTDTLIHGATLDNPFEADELLRQAAAHSARLVTRYPNVAEYRLLRGSAFARRATILDALGAVSNAKDNHQSAVAVLTPLIHEYPDNGVYQIALAQARRNLADHLRLNDASELAPLEAATDSLDLLEATIEDFDAYLEDAQWSPFTAQIQSSLYESLAESLSDLGRHEEAEQAWQQAAFMGILLP